MSKCQKQRQVTGVHTWPHCSHSRNLCLELASLEASWERWRWIPRILSHFTQRSNFHVLWHHLTEIWQTTSRLEKAQQLPETPAAALSPNPDICPKWKMMLYFLIQYLFLPASTEEMCQWAQSASNEKSKRARRLCWWGQQWVPKENRSRK